MVVKIMSLFGYLKYLVPYCNRDPKRDHNFDNHPYELWSKLLKEGHIGEYIGHPYRAY